MDLNRGFMIAALAASSILAGCAGPRYGYGYGYNVPPPPAAAYEGPYGVAPGPGYVWTAGYYDLHGSNWVWVRGRYMRPPRRHSEWVPPHWVQSRHGWSRRNGYWR